MATPNFCFENRCVVVYDDDYECGNVPALSEECINNYFYHRNFATKEVITDDVFYFYKIVLTAGYYQDACIDYDSVENIYMEGNLLACDIEDNFYGTSKKLLYDFIKNSRVATKYGLTKYRFNKLTKGLDFDKAQTAVLDYLKKQEEILVNKVIDKIMDDYGYIEVKRVATFSNGETLYRQVG